jgi:uncharacterized SAM-binding protein YcdF (DUF218 family)
MAWCRRYDCQLLYLVDLGTARANSATSLVVAMSKLTSTVLTGRAHGDRDGRCDWEDDVAVGPYRKRAGTQPRTAPGASQDYPVEDGSAGRDQLAGQRELERGDRVDPLNSRVPTSWRSMRLANVRRAVLMASAVVVALLLLIGISGYFVFTKASADPVQHADAIIVLGGEHDGREDYGIKLARDGWAPTVVLSNPYFDDDAVMKRVCAESTAGIEVLCQRPSSLTTRGEAEMMNRLAAERSWKRIIVVTWKYHIPRARMVFQQCFSPDPHNVVMEAVPRDYDFSLGHWEFVYAYQYFALAKAFLQGDCG